MRKRAYLHGRSMVWNRVAQEYMESFERVYNERLRNPRATFSGKNTEKTLDRLPAIRLDHLYRMTDTTGIVEHAVFVVPNYPEGYTTDDNARALIVAILLEQLGIVAPAGSADLASRYLAFLWLAFDHSTNRFRNCLSYERQWQESGGFGRQPRPRTVGIGNCTWQVQGPRASRRCGSAVRTRRSRPP